MITCTNLGSRREVEEMCGLTQYDELLELGVLCEHAEDRVQVLDTHQAALVHHQNTHPPKPPPLGTAVIVFLRALETQQHLEKYAVMNTITHGFHHEETTGISHKKQ